MGKSLYVSRMAEKLDREGEKSNHVIIPIHGPQVTSDLVLKSLQEYYGRAEGKIYHFDIAPNVLIFYSSFSRLYFGYKSYLHYYCCRFSRM